MGRARRGKPPAQADALQRRLAELTDACTEPSSARAASALRAALAGPISHLVARAAVIVAEHRLSGLVPELLGAYGRTFDDPVKRDPGCRAKKAILDALDVLEHDDPDPFWTAARHRQLEPGWGGATDTAAAVRVRGAMALARLDHPDVLLLLGELLADPEPEVRRGAADALVYHGDRAGAALAAQKVAAGDDDPVVVSGAMLALIELATDWGVRAIRPLLLGRDPERQELAAIALGQSRKPAALDLLLEWLDQAMLPAARERAITAIGLHRDPRARERLLRLIGEGDRSTASAAIVALAVHRYDPGLVTAVREAAARNRGLDLAPVLARALGPTDG